MASKVSGSRKLKKSNLPKFKADVYSKIPSDGLIVFAVHYLIEQKIDITLEDIVSVCFLLFPRKFGLKRYPKWPDSAPISRHWGDVRRKKYVTANDYLGYRLTTKGIRLVKKAAKVLGVTLPKPMAKVQSAQKKKATAPASSIKKASPVRVKKIDPAPVKPVEKSEIKAQPVQEEKATTPASSIKKARPVRVKKITPVTVNLIQKPEIKIQPVQEEKTTQIELIKTHPVRAKKAQVFPRSKPIQSAKAPIKVEGTKPAEPVIVQPVKVEKVHTEPVSRESRERAGKFTRMMERSDAYIHYKKHGSNSKINEFDFRSLLLCTMESSAETLARNVELFKGYAGIHNRQDLIAFLVFCEDKFSYLLKPQNKLSRKEKK